MFLRSKRGSSISNYRWGSRSTESHPHIYIIIIFIFTFSFSFIFTLTFNPTYIFTFFLIIVYNFIFNIIIIFSINNFTNFVINFIIFLNNVNKLGIIVYNMYICSIKILYYILYIPGCNADNIGYLTIFNVIFPLVLLQNRWKFLIFAVR